MVLHQIFVKIVPLHSWSRTHRRHPFPFDLKQNQQIYHKLVILIPKISLNTSLMSSNFLHLFQRIFIHFQNLAKTYFLLLALCLQFCAQNAIQKYTKKSQNCKSVIHFRISRIILLFISKINPQILKTFQPQKLNLICRTMYKQ